MGQVFAAYDDQLDRKVAIKTLWHVDAAGSRAAKREAKAMARLNHPNVVQVFESGEHEGELYIAMEFVAGEPLDQWQAEPTRTWREVLAVYLQAGEGLAAAHRAGLVHRDFKPSNVVVAPTADGRIRARVLDFGLARSASSRETHAAPRPGCDGGVTNGLSTVDVTDARAGTPAYMAPEQAAGEPLDGLADQFSFCVSLWEGLYTQRPFEGDTRWALATAAAEGSIRLPPKSEVPSRVQAVLRRGLSPKARDRYPSMDALLEALRGTPRSGRGRWFAGSGVVVLVAGSLWFATRSTETAPCTAAARHIDPYWQGGPRATAEAAFGATGLPYATHAWNNAAAKVDAYAREWVAAHQEACAATIVHHEQTADAMELRLACFDRARNQFAAVAGVLAGANDDTVTMAQGVLDTLSPLSACDDLAALRAVVQPVSAAEAEAVEEIRKLLGQMAAQLHAGAMSAARVTYDRAQQAAADVSYEPIGTDLSAAQAEILAAEGQYEDSAAALRDAIGMAARHAQQAALGSAAGRLMHVLAAQLGRAKEALAYRELVLGLATASSDILTQGGARTFVATALHADGQFQEAIALAREALELYETERNEHLYQIAEVRNNIAAGLLLSGDAAGAVVEHRKAQTEYVELLGPGHPAAIASRDNLAAALGFAGDHEPAEAMSREALEARIALVGADHPDVAGARDRLAGILYGQGKYADAELQMQKAVAILTAALGPDSARVLTARTNLAATLDAQGRPEEAIQIQREILARLVPTLGDDHRNVASARSKLASSLEKVGHREEAVALAEAAWDRRQRDDIAPDERAATARLLADLYWSRATTNEERHAARALAERAVSDLVVAGPGYADELRKARAWLDEHAVG